MTTEMKSIVSQATDWHIRLRYGDDAMWDAFTDWLAQDPRNMEAYEAIEITDLALDLLLPSIVFREAANDSETEPSASRPARRWMIACGALATLVIAALMIAPRFMPDHYDIATRAGETRVVRLDYGTQLVLNGTTRMTFDRNDKRFAALTAGEALFHVRHDAARPFILDVGDSKIEDAGTVFNVVRDSDEVRVAVAEGKVVFNPGRDAIALGAGQGLVAAHSGGSVRIVRAAIEGVGSWQRGQLIYKGEPLSQVAQDLSRTLGAVIAVSPEIAARPFHGTIAIDGSRSGELKRLKHALGVELEPVSSGWKMKPIDSGDK